MLVEETVTIPEQLADLARVGIVMEAAPGLEQTEWFGRGPVESYPDRWHGSPVSRWRSTVTDNYVPYVRPQENGGRNAVRWLELSDGSGRGFRLAFDRPCQVSATHYRAVDPRRSSTWTSRIAAWGRPAAARTRCRSIALALEPTRGRG